MDAGIIVSQGVAIGLEYAKPSACWPYRDGDYVKQFWYRN